MSEQILFRPHSLKQEQAVFCQKRILLLATGTQYGKTQVGALRMKLKTHQFTSPDDNFIITSPTYPTMIQSTLPPFLKLMDGYGEWNKKDNCFRLYNGGTVWLRTETDPDSIVGITNVRHIWGDEAGKYRLYFWENIQNRADFGGCGIDLTTSPYALNWVWKELIKPFREGVRLDDLEVIQAASWENPYHSLADPTKRAKKRAQMDIRRFNMAYGGEFGRMEGLVYDCWDEDQNLCEPFNLPSGTRIYGGIDWGYNPDPFVCSIRAITPSGDHFKVSEFYKTGMTITDMVAYAKMAKRTWGVQTFYADPSQPGYIEEFNRNACSCAPADNDVNRGIGLHYELIKTRRFKIFKGSSPHTVDEIQTYHYPEPKDLRPDEDSKEQKPVKQNDHCLDSDRYITIMTYRSQRKLRPTDPQSQKIESQEQRLRRLMRKRPFGSGPRSEDFSDYEG